jgi:hypothetical protein
MLTNRVCFGETILNSSRTRNAKDVLRFFTAPATDGTFRSTISARTPGDCRPIGESEPDLQSKLCFPDQEEALAKLRQEVEAGKKSY